MAPSITQGKIKVKSGYWRTEILARTEGLRVKAVTLPESPMTLKALEHLDRAAALATESQNLAEVWSGSQIDRGWTELRIAEECIIQAAERPPAILTEARSALSKARGQLADGDVRVAALSQVLSSWPETLSPEQSELIRATTTEVVKATHEVGDQQRRNRRELRNVLRNLTTGLATLAIGLAAGALVMPVPTGWIVVPEGLAAGYAIAVALMLGALGSLFTAVPSLAQAPTNSMTFNPAPVQAALKVVVGAWSALVGLVAVSATVAPVGIASASPAGFAMMCALFGAGQEAITRFVDRQAAETKPSTSQ